jgi:hypothetical protein
LSPWPGLLERLWYVAPLLSANVNTTKQRPGQSLDPQVVELLGQSAVSYALPYTEAVKVAEEMGWTKTVAWNEGGQYTTTSPSKRLLAILERYEMGPDKWWALVVGSEVIA